MTIRDTSDVRFTGTRCSEIPTVTKTIAQILAYAVGDSTIPANISIEGVIVSATTNEAAGNYRLQDATGGIQIRFAIGSNPVPGALGDKLKVSVGGQKFGIFQGGLQIANLSTSSTTGTGNTVISKDTTIAGIISHLRAWESTVVTLRHVKMSPAGSSSTGITYNVTDASGTIQTFVRTTSGITMYDTASSITGYVSVFQSTASDPLTPQITLRTQADIVDGGYTVTPPPPTGEFTATYAFTSVVSGSGGRTDPTPPPTVDGLTFSNFTAVGSGLSANPNAGGRFSFTGWPLGATNSSDNFTGDIDLSTYYEVTITPTVGTTLDLTKLAFTVQRSATGIRQMAVRSNIDGYATNLPVSIDPANTMLSVVVGPTVAGTNTLQISDASSTAQDGTTIIFGTSYKNLTTPVTIRIYGFNSEAAAGSFGIDNVTITGTAN
jgi:predicted lipoprotein